MKLNELKGIARGYGFHVTQDEEGELRLDVNGTEEAAYYTHDIDDCHGTILAIVAARPKPLTDDEIIAELTPVNAYSPSLEYAQDMIFEDHGHTANILHIHHDGSGTVCAVFEAKGTRFYRAFEFTDDSVTDLAGKVEHNLQYAYGYETAETACYMGQRYDSPAMWGPYHAEVFTHCGTIYNEVETGK